MKIPQGRDLLAEGWCVLDASNGDMLEAWLLFCIAVAGKTAKTTTRAINNFLSERENNESPFEFIHRLACNGELRSTLKRHRVGQYNKLVKAYSIVCSFSTELLKHCSVADLETISGIGPKTSRFFIQSTRENTRYAVLDTHVLAWMKALGYNVPKSTPSKKKYALIEKQFLELADQLGKTPRELDTEIWLSRARI